MRTNENYEQYIEVQQRKETIFRDHPELKRLDLAKSRWMRFLLIFMLASRLLNIALIVRERDISPILLLGASFIGYAIYAIILFGSMRGKGQNVYLLYVLLLSMSNTLIKHFRNFASLGMLIQVHISLFQTNPLVAISDILLYAAAVLHVGVTIWLTLIPKNQKLAKQYDTLMKSGGTSTPSGQKLDS